jgi:hypothetical protein
MTPIWTILALLGFGIVASTIAWSRERGRDSDLGSVSHHWIAEHRLSQTQEQQR